VRKYTTSTCSSLCTTPQHHGGLLPPSHIIIYEVPPLIRARVPYATLQFFQTPLMCEIQGQIKLEHNLKKIALVSFKRRIYP